ncbi:MAG: hypothetical protein E6929_00245 [Clostridium sp.]|nr:hypothetical protein [Clostridium sp.]
MTWSVKERSSKGTIEFLLKKLITVNAYRAYNIEVKRKGDAAYAKWN